MKNRSALEIYKEEALGGRLRLVIFKKIQLKFEGIRLKN